MAGFSEEILEEFGSDGFFYNIRKMNFVKIEAVRAIEKIRHLDPGTCSESEKKEAAYLIWELPVHALWWRDRCVAMGADKAEFDAYAHELQRVVAEKMKALLDQS
ncbi:hypothetical protein CO670_17515 [Rhizobium sp. J15]|uniref:hypothetical protein n=1 Tax=Rhizobium sp. J15 TaxID=2035450 RepID=UPI000BE94C48|nr:hypothetical protein [Rhizobium sp. J15]PDT15563.1 hypothetical protein CO670_17515 [Rhizobium sp. J15]